MAEYASKGLANGLGIPALVLGSLGFLNSGGLGGLGGILGGGNAAGAAAVGLGVMAEKDAKIAELTAEKYADKVGIETYAQTRRENEDLRDRLLGNWIKPIAEESANNKVVIARIEEQLKCMNKTSELREQNMAQKIDCVAAEAAHGIAEVGAGLAALRHTVNGFTKTVIDKDAICPAVMPRYNSWEAPTDTAPATQPVSGRITVNS